MSGQLIGQVRRQVRPGSDGAGRSILYTAHGARYVAPTKGGRQPGEETTGTGTGRNEKRPGPDRQQGGSSADNTRARVVVVAY